MKHYFEHLQEHKISWAKHGKRSFLWAVRLQIASIKLCIHSVCPWVFVTDASEEISRLHEEMKEIIVEEDKSK